MVASLPVHQLKSWTHSTAYTDIGNSTTVLSCMRVVAMLCHLLLLSPMLHFVCITKYIFCKYWCSL
jgi:hypothetical protein